jgi:hypothetical protein
MFKTALSLRLEFVGVAAISHGLRTLECVLCLAAASMSCAALACGHLAAGLQPAQRQRGEAEVPHKVLRRHHLHEQTTASSSQWTLQSSTT